MGYLPSMQASAHLDRPGDQPRERSVDRYRQPQVLPKRDIAAPPPPASSAPVLDLAVFRSFQEMLDAETLAQTYRELMVQTRSRLPVLAHGATSEAVMELAHGMRGATAMMGATCLAHLAAGLEAAPVSGSAALRAAEQIEAACAALEAALREQQVRL